MGFFAQFDAWLRAVLLTYIDANTAAIANALSPAILTLAVIYVMVWGYLQMMGKIEEPITAGLKRILLLAIVLGAALHMWLYNQVIVNTFLDAPGQLGAAVLGADESVTVVDQILLDGNSIAERLLAQGDSWDFNISQYLAAGAIYICVGLIAIYTIFLLSLSRLALSVLMALGPLFITCLLFESFKKLFEAWLAQLANYAFITILTMLLAALMLTLMRESTGQTAEIVTEIEIADVVRLCFTAVLGFLVMRQVLPMSAALGGGVSLVTHGALSSLATYLLGRATVRRQIPLKPQMREGTRRLAQGVKKLVRRDNSISPA